MTELFQQLLEWVSQNPGWSHSIIFLIAMAESLAIVGMIVPGVVIMFGIGALISTGAIAFWPAMGWAVAGAIVGDGFSFWLGSYYRDKLTGLWPFSRHPEQLERGVTFFQKYGGKSVAIGRFFGPVRAVIPMVAGMMEMPAHRFVAANIASALVWAPAYLLPGMVFGASLELASAVALRLVILLLVIALIAWITFALAHRLFLLLHPYNTQLLYRLLSWSERHPLPGSIATALVDPNHPETKSLSILTSVLLIATLLFFALLTQLAGGYPLLSADQWVLDALQSLRTPVADEIMVYMSRLTDPLIVTALIISTAALLIIQGHKRTALYWGAAALFCILASPLLKMGLQLPRPEIANVPPSSYAFPSGHTLKAVVLYGFLAIIIGRALAPSWRWLPYSIAATLITSVALSRLYLGVHWLSDILGSITLGISWIALLGIAYHHHTRVETHWKSLTAVSLLSVMITFGIETRLNHDTRIVEYQPQKPAITILTEKQWKTQSPLSSDKIQVEFTGDPGWLADQLASQGWQQGDTLSWGNMLKLLSPELPLSQMPIIPRFDQHAPAGLHLIKPLDHDSQIALHLWPTHFIVSPDMTPVWTITTQLERKRSILGAIHFAQADSASSAITSTLETLSALPKLKISRQDKRTLVWSDQ